MSSSDKIAFTIDRQRQIQEGDNSVFREMFDAGTMTSHGLRQLAGNLQLTFSGYDDEDRLPFAIPEIRGYLRRLRMVWPYAPFFCDLSTGFIMIEALCHVDQLQILQHDRNARFDVRFNIDDLRRYVRQSHKTLRSLGKRAGYSKAEIRNRIEQFDGYLCRHGGTW